MAQVRIVCETNGCPNKGKVINTVSNITPDELDMFYEGFDGSDPADSCKLCGKLGILQDPESE